ncbi:MAG: radical SAM protein [Myxococcales bacterium]
MTGRKPLVLVPQHFGSLVFDRRTARYLPFDHDATEFLCRSAATPWQPGPNADFVRHFERQGFFDLSGRFAADLLQAIPPADHLLGPLAVHLEVVARCNLSCAHCFASPMPRPGDALSLAELEPLFAELASLGAFRLGITGGEPLLRPDLFELLDLALAAGLHPCITTNGLLIDEHVAWKLGRRGLVWLNVSLDGADAPTNDAIRGPGTFEHVLEGLSVLRRHARFSLAFTLTSTNASQAGDCARLAREVGAEAAVFRPLYPVGAARSRPELLHFLRNLRGRRA